MSYPALIVMPVSNVESATATYRALLGVDPYVTSEYYVGFKTGDAEIGLDPNGTVGPLPYWDIDDLDGTIAALTEAGATVMQAPSEVVSGLTIAVLTDGDGNPIGLRSSNG